MKKIVSIFLIVIFLASSISWGDDSTEGGTTAFCRDGTPPINGLCSEPSTTCNPACDTSTQICDGGICVSKSQDKIDQEQSGTPPTDSPGAMGIECDQTQLVNGQCKFNIYDTLGIRKSVRNSGDPTSVGLFVQDIILSATFFIGTLVTVALIVSGLMYIFAASSGKDPADARKGIIGSLLGLLIVVSSYVIIRLVQYIAKGF